MNTTDLAQMPARPNLEQYKKQAKEFVKAFKAGDETALKQVRRFHPRFSKVNKKEDLIGAGFALADAQSTIARAHGFLNWARFIKHIDGLNNPDSTVYKFEQAADAIVDGDLEKLKMLLKDDPDLVHAHSPRAHNATLLHYTGSNGFENWRQKAPKNIAAIARLLLDAGADVNAVGDMYRGSTTLGLAATSVHPVTAGVQKELIDVLLEYGATFESPVAPDYARGNVVNACLANGRGEGAKYLAEKGAPVDLEGAAGVGNLDLVKSFFDDGNLTNGATEKQMESGLIRACQYGHPAIVEFLLDHRANINAGEDTDMTPLHMAVLGGHDGLIRRLLERGAKLEALNMYNGTPLGQAMWCVVNQTLGPEYAEVVKVLVDAGAEYGDDWADWLESQPVESEGLKKRVVEILRSGKQ